MLNYLSRLNLTSNQLKKLFTVKAHTPYLTRHRHENIYYRIQLVALIFAILTPLWIIVDILTLPWPQWGLLAGLRLVATGIFIFLAWPDKEDITTKHSFRMLVTLLFIPPLFYLITIPILSDGVLLTSTAKDFASFYALLPLIVLAGLSLFPLTLLEILFFGVPMMLLIALGLHLDPLQDDQNVLAFLWLGFLLLCVSGFSALNQLRYMITLVSTASHDQLTGVYTRRSGREILDVQYRVSARQGSSFAVMFLDIDHFKAINDTYGHNEGDKILIQFCDAMRKSLRGSDIIIRWGGEEFIIVLPSITEEGLNIIINRFLSDWFGQLPDGALLTASIGVSERASDVVDDWPRLIEIADERMYKAKEHGRKRAISLHDEEIVLTFD